MKRFVSLGLTAIILATTLAVGSARNAQGQSAGLVSSVLGKMERNRMNLKSLRSGISMAKFNPQLGLTEKFAGVVSYVPKAGRNDSVRIEWSSPQQEILAVSGGSYTLFRPRLKVAYKGLVNKGPEAANIMGMMDMSSTELKTRFEAFQDVREENLGGVSTIHMKLVPKGHESYKFAEIWVDGDGMPVQLKWVERNDDATTIHLVNMEKNVVISPGIFILKLDADVKIIRT
jgi:outer membrane lipoprotein-sorting protein